MILCNNESWCPWWLGGSFDMADYASQARHIDDIIVYMHNMKYFLYKNACQALLNQDIFKMEIFHRQLHRGRHIETAEIPVSDMVYRPAVLLCWTGIRLLFLLICGANGARAGGVDRLAR